MGEQVPIVLLRAANLIVDDSATGSVVFGLLAWKELQVMPFAANDLAHMSCVSRSRAATHISDRRLVVGVDLGASALQSKHFSN